MTKKEKLDVLAQIAEKFNGAGITWGIGASLMLYFHEITDEFHDIDIMVILEDAEAARMILSSMGEMMPPNPKKEYRTAHFYEFVIEGVDVDVMAGFSVLRDGELHECAFNRDSVLEHVIINGQDIPLQSVAEWRRFYELMGRTAKVEMIDAWERKKTASES